MSEPINSFTGPYRFLSNFYPLGEGLTAEHYFQAAKCKQPHEAAWVMAAPGPATAKKRGRSAALRTDWQEVKRDVMLNTLRAKFADPGLRELLLATGDALLTEGNTWHDQYWGNCTCPMHAAVEGSNWLGKLLMQVREELRDGDKNGPD